MRQPEFAHTGPHPDGGGFVGFVNIRKTDDGAGVIFSVRCEGENPTLASYVIPTDQAVALLSGALVGLGGPLKHEYWMAGEADCPAELKAGNGELHTLRCKRCGKDNPLNQICFPA